MESCKIKKLDTSLKRKKKIQNWKDILFIKYYWKMLETC